MEPRNIQLGNLILWSLSTDTLVFLLKIFAIAYLPLFAFSCSICTFL